MASKVVKKMSEDFLVCSICMGPFKTPKMLPCIHSFCEGCLEKCAAKQDHKNIPCPLCRKICNLPETGVKSLQTNFHLINLAERVSILEKFTSTVLPLPPCEPCKSPEIVAFCPDCDFAICSKCQVHHTLYPVLRDHDVVPLSKLKDPKFQQEWKTSKPPKCEVHKSEKLHLFCKTCSKLICNHCAIVVHSKHECTEATNQFQSVRDALREQVESSDALLESGVKISDRGETAFEAMKKANHEVELEIEKHCDDMLKKMEKAIHDEKEMLISEIDVKPKNVQNQIQRVKDWIERMKITQEMSRKLLEENNPWEMIAMSNDLMKSFEELRDGSSSLDWLDSDLEHEVNFNPSLSIPAIDLGFCDFGPISPDVVVSDNRGNFFLCQFSTKNGRIDIHKRPYNGNDTQQYAPIKCSTKLHKSNELFACCDNKNSLYFTFGTTVVIIPDTFNQVRTCVVQMQGYGTKVQCLGYGQYRNQFCVANDSVGGQNMMQGSFLPNSNQADTFQRTSTYSLPATSPITYILPADRDVLYYTEKDGLKTYAWGNDHYHHKTYQIDPPTNVMTIAKTELLRAVREQKESQKYISHYGHNRYFNSFTVFILWKGTTMNTQGEVWVIKEYNTDAEKVMGVLECPQREQIEPMALYNHTDNNTEGMYIYLCDKTGTITRFKRGKYNDTPVQYTKV